MTHYEDLVAHLKEAENRFHEREQSDFEFSEWFRKEIAGKLGWPLMNIVRGTVGSPPSHCKEAKGGYYDERGRYLFSVRFEFGGLRYDLSFRLYADRYVALVGKDDKDPDKKHIDRGDTTTVDPLIEPICEALRSGVVSRFPVGR